MIFDYDGFPHRFQQGVLSPSTTLTHDMDIPLFCVTICDLSVIYSTLLMNHYTTLCNVTKSTHLPFFELPSWITFQFVLVQYQCCHADSPHCFLMHSDTTAEDERSHYEAWIMEDCYLISEGVFVVRASILCSPFTPVQCCFFCSLFSTFTM